MSSIELPPRNRDPERSPGTEPSAGEAVSAYSGWLLPTCAVARGVALPGSFLVFVLYWALVFPYMTGPLHPLSVLTHGANFLVMVADMVITRQVSPPDHDEPTHSMRRRQLLSVHSVFF